MSNCTYPSKNFGEQTPKEVLDCTTNKISETALGVQKSFDALQNPSTATMNDYFTVIAVVIGAVVVYGWIKSND